METDAPDGGDGVHGLPFRPSKGSKVEFEETRPGEGGGGTYVVQPGPRVKVDETDGLSRRSSFLRRKQAIPLSEKVVQPTSDFADGSNMPEDDLVLPSGRPKPPPTHQGLPTTSKLASVGSEKLRKPPPGPRLDAEGKPLPSGPSGTLADMGGPAMMGNPEEAMAERERLASTFTTSEEISIADNALPSDVVKAKSELAGKIDFLSLSNVKILIDASGLAENERLERERAQKAKEDDIKLAADRHNQQVEALADLKRLLVRPRSFLFPHIY